ncbi:MAG: urease accessory protein [Pseudomonadota bacterium]|nr:urease accessory protein [Pseudomonadales bacterium]MDY6920781.1 urease accessory protein [Pseudomonadota bacterium]
MTALLMLGFMLGIRHALEADHIATVASLASRYPDRRQVMFQGLAWGLGHSGMLLLVGLVVLWTDTLIPEQVASLLEAAVGGLMLVLGLAVLRRVFTADQQPEPELRRESEREAGATAAAAPLPVRALMMGSVHGMAGSAALLLLFVDQVQSLFTGLLYISTFGLGSILGMLLFSLAISVPIGLTAHRLQGWNRMFQLAIGAVTIVVGARLMISVWG